MSGDNEERELRDRLEEAQARVALLEDDVDALADALERETKDHDELVELVDDLRGALERLANPEQEPLPGQAHELVKLRAQVSVLKHSLARAEDTVHALTAELKALKAKRK